MRRYDKVRSNLMKKLSYFIVLILFISSCSPASTAASPTEISTGAIIPTATNTITPQPTSTSTPTITPSPTLSLPVSYQTPIPASGSKIDAENVKDLQEIARYYGQMYFTAALSIDRKTLIVRDSLGIDTYDYQTNKHLNHINLLGSINQSDLQISADGKWALVDQIWLIHFTSNIEYKIQDLNSTVPMKEGNSYREIHLSPDGHKLMIVEFRCDNNGCMNDYVELINLPDMHIFYSWNNGGYSDIHGWEAVFSPDGSFIAARIDNQMIIWRTSDQTQVMAIKNIQGNSPAVFSSDSSTIAIGQLNTVQIWDVASGKEIQTISRLCGELYDPPQPIILYANRVVILECPAGNKEGEGKVSVWTVPDATAVYEDRLGSIRFAISRIVYDEGQDRLTLLENPRNLGPWLTPNTLYTFQFLDNGDLTLIQLDDQLKEMACIIKLSAQVNCALNVVLGTDEQFYHYTTHDNLMEFYRGFTQTSNATAYSLPWKNASLEALDPTNKLLFYTKHTGLNTSYSGVINLDNNQSRGEWQNSFIERMVFSDNKKYAALCRKDGVFGVVFKPNIDRLIIFDLLKGNVLYQQAFTCFVPLVLSRDGKKLIAAHTLPTYSHRLLIMNTIPPIEKKDFDIGCNQISALALSPDETVLAVACNDGTLRFLNPDTASEISRITNIDPNILGLAFSKDGTKLAMVSKRGFISIWAIPPFNYRAYQVSPTPPSSSTNQIYSWEFETAGDSEGWTAQNQLTPPQISNGYLITKSTGIDPFLISPDLVAYAKKLSHIEIRMSVSAGNLAQLYFITGSDGNYNESKVLPFPITADGQFHTYTLDMSKVNKWSGAIAQIRLDPTVTQAIIKIDYIRILP